ncbi:Coenzyme A biosynthesis bifunctional protein coaBC [Entamoeba marina]
MENTTKKIRILIGVTASIAAYKAIEIANILNKKGYDVHVTMTQNTTHLVTPLAFESLTYNKCILDTFERVGTYDITHVSLAHSADVFLIAPASADIIAKVAHGIADDFLTTSFLAATCPKLIAPAMNTTMLYNSITQRNIQSLKNDGVHFVSPSSGRLACGDVGEGKLALVDDIVEAVELLVPKPQSLKSKKILITAGPTIEHLDPVRFLTNHSTGAEVVLVTGPTNIKKPSVTIKDVKSAIEMHEAVMQESNVDIYIMAAAVSDYRPAEVSEQKIKKSGDELNVKFIKNPDILYEIGTHKTENQIVVGFAMETQDLIINAQEKLKKKNCDLIVANQLNVPGAGFAGDTNKVEFISKDGIEETEVIMKTEVAKLILEKVIKMQQ